MRQMTIYLLNDVIFSCMSDSDDIFSVFMKSIC